MRFVMCLLFAGLFGAWVAADDAPVGDPIDAELTKACDEYQVAADTAKNKLLAAMDELKEKTESNRTIKVDQKIKLVESIDRERKIFVSESLKPPRLDKLRGDVNEYKRKITAATAKCADAFDAAAEKYGKIKDLEKAKEVLEEKRRFSSGERTDDFIVKTVWTGEMTVVEGAREKRIDVGLWITEREPGQFKGRFESEQQTFEVSGTVSVRGIRWSIDDTKVTRGNAAFAGTGKVKGMYLFLTSPDGDRGGLGRSGKVALSRHEIREPK